MRFWHCFDGPLFTLLLRGGFPTQGHGNGRTQATQHWTDESKSSLLVTCTHNAGEEDNACHAGSQGGCTWEQSEQLEAVGGRLCGTKGEK